MCTLSLLTLTVDPAYSAYGRCERASYETIDPNHNLSLDWLSGHGRASVSTIPSVRDGNTSRSANIVYSDRSYSHSQRIARGESSQNNMTELAKSADSLVTASLFPEDSPVEMEVEYFNFVKTQQLAFRTTLAYLGELNQHVKSRLFPSPEAPLTDQQDEAKACMLEIFRLKNACPQLLPFVRFRTICVLIWHALAAEHDILAKLVVLEESVKRQLEDAATMCNGAWVRLPKAVGTMSPAEALCQDCHFHAQPYCVCSIGLQSRCTFAPCSLCVCAYRLKRDRDPGRSQLNCSVVPSRY